VAGIVWLLLPEGDAMTRTIRFEIVVDVDQPDDRVALADKIDECLAQYHQWSRWVNGPQGNGSHDAAGSRDVPSGRVSWKLLK
jgi:hypothetical protein